MLKRSLETMEVMEVDEANPCVAIESVPECAPVLPNCDIPPHWTNMPSGVKSMAVPLPEGTLEYTAVKECFLPSMDKVTKGRPITGIKIYRVQNPFLWRHYSLKRHEMAVDNRNTPVLEKHLFHGTKYSTLDAICEQGFDWRVCGGNGVKYGQGCYFARESAFAHQYCPRWKDPSEESHIIGSADSTPSPPQRSVLSAQDSLAPSRSVLPTQNNLASGGSQPQSCYQSPSFQSPSCHQSPAYHQPQSCHQSPSYHQSPSPAARKVSSGFTIRHILGPADGHTHSLDAAIKAGGFSNFTLKTILTADGSVQSSAGGFSIDSIFTEADGSQSTATVVGTGDTFSMSVNGLPLPNVSVNGVAQNGQCAFPMPSSANVSVNGVTQNGQCVFPLPQSANVSVNGVTQRTHCAFPIHPSAFPRHPSPFPLGLPHPSAFPVPPSAFPLPPSAFPLPPTCQHQVMARQHPFSPICLVCGVKTDEQASTSRQRPTNKRYMILSRVLVGQWVRGYPNFRRPPPVIPGNPHGRLYDSCVSSVVDPMIFVVFDSNQAYPEYVVEYSE